MWPVIAPIASAAVAALSAILVAIFSARRARENQQSIEELKASLEDENSSKNARREYEFRARQRLYEQYEPLRFQLLEAVDTAKCQIETLSEQALEKDLQRLGSTPTGNYWLLGTIYHLLHPSAVFRILQRRLTMVDLRIEPTIHMEYTLAKKIYLALTHDARVADLGSLRYTPYVDGWIDKRELNPEQFRRQGLPLGRLDNVVDMLIIRQGETTDQERIATFGEFETRFGAASPEDVSGPAGAARDLFVGFNPSRRPILWRLLLAQFAIYKALLASIENKRPPLTILQEPWTSLSDKECEALGVPSSDGPPKPGSAFSDAAKYLQVYVLPDVRRVSSDRPA